MLEQLLTLPGFLYQLGEKYYFLGKWICKECPDTDAADCVYMYAMCRNASDMTEAGFYFQKLRAYSDLALEVPYNPQLIRKNMKELLASLPETAAQKLNAQMEAFSEDLLRYSQ